MKHFLNRSTILIAALVAAGGALAAWKVAAIADSAAESASQPEPTESVIVAAAKERSHTPATTAVGTVVALRSVTLRNELAGTVAA